MPIEDKSQKWLLTSESSSALKKKWFNSYKFFTGTRILDIKYWHPRSKYNSSFYPFNDQLDYTLAYYFAESETTKGNFNKFLTDLLIVPLTEKLSYKNVDKWIEKLSEIS